MILEEARVATRMRTVWMRVLGAAVLAAALWGADVVHSPSGGAAQADGVEYLQVPSAVSTADFTTP